MPDYEPMTHAEKIQWMLDEKGWGAVPVRPHESGHEWGAGYTYTFGLEARYGHPELVIFGMQPAMARRLMDLVVAQVSAGVQLPVGTPFVGLLDNDLRAALVPVVVDEVAALFPTCTDIYGEQDWRMTQFVWPAANGAFPWEDGWPEELAHTQPILPNQPPA